MKKTLIVALLLSVLPVLPLHAAEPPLADQDAPDTLKQSPKRYYLEISISGRKLWLYEKKGDGERVAIAEYPVGTAVKGLATYPLGLGKVTGIYFDPWWNPTPYSRYVFKKRGIELPSKVPPGDPLNYMGPFKIALSHRTWKGAIYRIHGNNDPKRVGRRVTGGCFVMNNGEGLELAHKIRVGTEVNIIP
jgi:L,D-transpeptidase YnhG